MLCIYYPCLYVNKHEDILNSNLPNMLTWSSSNNLAFNKTKAILFTTSQMEKLHGFEQDVVEIKCKDKKTAKCQRIQTSREKRYTTISTQAAAPR